MDADDRKGFTFLERIMLQHASPLKLAWDGAGLLLGIRLIYQRRLAVGVGSLLGGSLLGSVLVWRQDPHELASTRLGVWMLGQAEPANLIVRTVGFVVVLLSIWHRSWLAGGGGLAIIAAGRVLGEHRRRLTPPPGV